MVIANITDPIDLPWNNPNNLFTRLFPESIVRREERIKKQLKGKGMFGEIPFMQLSAPFYLSFEDFPMPNREGAASAATECQRYGMTNGCDEHCPVLRAGLCEFQNSDNAALYAAATSNNV